ncbi:MAG: 16S rRNA pseudouridine(516) synthase [Rhodoferax sp.]|jgi:16S rRNA pseudouridine516 synthase|nr:16S rRNA pseudouridine(516) synthase [Rhodoferax sp.]MCL4739059.1 16S rRNA pseudouridine(516) synthase [Burkholderiaceae bacterium]MCP5290882.1 16S rRNA pseudouridine(516) synthase [Burkholderiaceae bacterium]
MHETTAIDRILFTQGFGSRRECAALCRAGRVAVGGRAVDDPQAEFDTEALVLEVDGVAWPYRVPAIVMLHKPLGVECSREPSHHASVFELLPPPLARRGVQPVGRLDADTSGLLLLTDDGALLHRLTSPKRRVAKVYEVTTRHPLTPAMLDALRDGVVLRDDPAPVRAEAAEATGECALRLTLTGGRYHQVRRMVAAAGNRVEALHRSGFGPLVLPADLARGQWRWVDPGALQDVASTTGAASAADSAGASGANRATEAVAAPR